MDKKVIEYLEDRIFANLPIDIGGIKIYSPTLKEIYDVGVRTYRLYITACMAIADEGKYQDFADYLKAEGLKSETNIKALNFFTKESFASFDKEDKTFYYVDKDEPFFLTEDSHSLFGELILIANDIKPEEKPKESKNPEFDKRLAEAKKRVTDATKDDKEEDEDFFKTYISSLSAASPGLNLITIWDLNIAQFTDQLQRHKLKEDFDINMQYLLAGADSKDVKLEHYIKKI